MKYKVSQIVKFIKQNLNGKIIDSNCSDEYVYGFSSLDNSKMNTITWISSPSINFDKIKSSLIIINNDIEIKENKAITIAKVANPRLAFAKITRHFFQHTKDSYIHETAIIHSSAVLGEKVTIGPYCVINENVKIGNNTVLESHILIDMNVNIGEDCYIKTNTTIGQEGFGVIRDYDNSLIKIPHIGSVVIGNNVEIGSMNTINRGTIDNTNIQDGVKMDDHVHIAHNCSVGKDTVITPGVTLCGSVTIEKESWLGAQCTIIESTIVREKTIVGIGSVVLRNTEPDSTYIGNPARKLPK